MQQAVDAGHEAEAFIERRIRAEQTALSLRSMASTYGTSSAVVVIVSVLMALWDETHRTGLALWCVATVGLKLFLLADARRRLARGLAPDEVPALMRLRVALNAVHGCAWGALPWVALGADTPGLNLLVLAWLASVTAGSMVINAATPPVFAAFVVPLTALLVWRLWWLEAAAYRLAAVGTLVYMANLGLQCRGMCRSARESIHLRFENLALARRLTMEGDRTQHALAQAEQANEAKSRLLAAVGHDLRQPLHAHGLFMELLARTDLHPEQAHLLGHMRATARACAEMLDTLLDLSRIEAGVIRPECRDFRLDELFHEVEREFGPQANRSGLVYRTRDARFSVHSDPALVKMIVRNLVANAIRYCASGGLLVAGRRRGADVWIEVWDTGIGIAPAEQAHVFDAFYQVGNPERDRRNGLGLGLAICQGLAGVLGRRLWLGSRPGRGSVFRLALPLAQAAQVQAQPASVPGPGPALRARVLVLDDDELGRTGMAQLLRTWGCECLEAGTLEQALALATHQPVEVLISDFRLGDHCTGVQAISAFRQAFNPAPAMLLVTGDTAPQRLRDALACGATLLHKPVAPEVLERSVRGCLALKLPEASQAVVEQPAGLAERRARRALGISTP